MDLPPSGWYPDPHGTPSLLRWWDGSVWTQHTHPDVTAAGSGGEPAATVLQSAVQGTDIQATTVQPAAQTSGLQATTVQPSADWLRRTKPPTGQPTAPQPALPTDPAAAAAAAAAAAGGVAPTAYQPAVTTVQPGVQPTAFQPAAVQPTAVQSAAMQAGGMQTVAMQPTAVQPGAGTQVLFGGGDPWQAPGMPAGPGGPVGLGGPMQGNPYGYQEAQRRRRRRLIGGLTAGTVAAIAAIAIIVANLGSSPSTPAAAVQSPTPPLSPSASAPSPTASASPTASPTSTASQSTLTDTQSGLSYAQLASPWQATASCSSTLNSVQAFPWTDGEYAIAGQVNGNNGPTTWYGEACSGPLPLQYGYSGSADLQGTAENLASTFENAYYNALDHTINQGNDNPTQISGHPAWEVTFDVSYTNASGQGATWTDEEAAVVVVDTGTDEPAVFFTSVPDTLNEANITTLVSSLQLSSTPSSANTQPAGNQPSDGANP